MATVKKEDVIMVHKEDDQSTEEELEKLVFGDASSFRNNLKQFSAAQAGEIDEIDTTSESESDNHGQKDIELANDTDIFYYDSGPGDPNASVGNKYIGTDSDDDAAWEDSDDKRIRVSLASVPRLRKLRIAADEDVISGKEYISRLRRQYETLHPKPQWAKELEARQKSKRAKRKARKMDVDGQDNDLSDSSSSTASSDENSTDDNSLSAQPLAKLLREMDGFASASGLRTKSSSKVFRPEVIDVQRSQDITGPQRSSVTSLSFHPRYPLLLSSGPSSTLYIHHLNPSLEPPNPLLTSLHIKDTSLCNTLFHPNPSDPRIFIGAHRRFFHVWNVSTGVVERITRVYGHQRAQRSMDRFQVSPSGGMMALLGTAKKGGGSINILDATTLQWAQEVRIESRGGIADFAWWRDSKGLTIAGKNGEVTEWDVAAQRPVARWLDEGALGTTVIALGGHYSGLKSTEADNDIDNTTDQAIPPGTDRYTAIGSSSGIVNIYDRRSILTSSTSFNPQAPTPLRTLSNLTTPISHLHFSPSDGQLLVVACQWKRDALRLVHMPSCTVYKNWPTSATPLGRITAVGWGDFLGGTAGGNGGSGRERKGKGKDKNGGRELALVVANEAGRVRMWEVRA